MDTAQIVDLQDEYDYLTADMIQEILNSVTEISTAKNITEAEKQKILKDTLRTKNEHVKASEDIRSYSTESILDVKFCSIMRGLSQIWREFPYSINRSHRRCAVLIGCTYCTSDNPLIGSSRDVAGMYSLLLDVYGYKRYEILVMTDVAIDEVKYYYHMIPTKDNILDAASKLRTGATNGDKLFFYYSGRAEQTGDLTIATNESGDSKDEVIVACDDGIDGTRKIITDHELRRVLCDDLLVDASLTCVFDSSHSGTILDLNHYVDPEGHHSSNSFVYPRGRNILCLSASEDGTLADRPTTQGVTFGLFTKVLIARLRQYPRMVVLDLLVAVNADLRNYGTTTTQRATLSSAESISRSVMFDLNVVLPPRPPTSGVGDPNEDSE